jgi:hypothetical protein
MKRHLILLATSLCLAAPVTAQEPYSGYGSDGNNRQFNFNPGNMMNGMGNPMRNMFGSSGRGYDDYGYPGAGYPPPAYPPTYGYPAYQAPYPGYAQPNQVAPDPAQATHYSYPSALPVPAEPAAPPASQASVYNRPPAAAQQYRPGFNQPDPASQYRFRPLEADAAVKESLPAQPAAEATMAPPSQQLAPTPAVPSPAQASPLAPLSYPPAQYAGQPLAPISYPESTPQAPASPPPVTQAPAVQSDPDLRFRPLDKPGYSSDLGQ